MNYDPQATLSGPFSVSSHDKKLKLGSNYFNEIPEPSRVVRLTGLGSNVLEADLYMGLKKFGFVDYAVLSHANEALVEFEDIQAAERCIKFYRVTKPGPIPAANVSCANIQRIPRHNFESAEPTKTLIMHILNPRHDVDVSMVCKICQKIAPVCRVLVNEEHGNVAALVEFGNSEVARMVKHELNGHDMFAGSNTLKIEYCTITSLIVAQNTTKTWDCSIAAAHHVESAVEFIAATPLHDTSTASTFSTCEWSVGPSTSAQAQASQPSSPVSHANVSFSLPKSSTSVHTINAASGNSVSKTPEQAKTVERVVVHVTNVHENLNCDHIFNLFCLYGNVTKVAILLDKRGEVMVQMSSETQARKSVACLRGALLLGRSLSLTQTDRTAIDRVNAGLLPDRTYSERIFAQATNNRYKTDAEAGSNRSERPSRRIYFFDAPHNVTAVQIHEVFSTMHSRGKGPLRCPLPESVDLYAKRTFVHNILLAHINGELITCPLLLFVTTAASHLVV